MRPLPTSPKIDDSALLRRLDQLTRGLKLAGVIPCCNCGEFQKEDKLSIVSLGGQGVCVDCLLGDENCELPDEHWKVWAKGLHPFYVKVSKHYLAQPYWNERSANARAAGVWAEMQRGVAKYSRQPFDGDALKVLLESLPDADKILKYILDMGGVGKVGLHQNPKDWKWCEWLGAYLTPADYALSRTAWANATSKPEEAKP